MIYVDTSAAMKLLVAESESAPLAIELAHRRDGGEVLVASWLLHAELHRAWLRHPQSVDGASVSLLLDSVDLVDLTRGDLLTAGSLADSLRTHDAIHLAVALRVEADAIAVYDEELAAASRSAGLAVIQPGRDGA